ncbi:MAG: PRC-barrel domain-containing protein [Syntrophomonas sp.]|nr:PRC-barrel domain-containing protein [Syntrophomonas sp.]
MKRSQEIIGLPVFSIVEGRKIGQVKDLVINPEEGRVEFILVSNGSWYVGARVLPYKAVMGVGEHAVTTESENLLATINETSTANSLLQRNIEVKGNRVLTNKGNLIGVISEYEIDETTGKVVRLEYKTAQNESLIDSVQADEVLTYGADVIVVKEKSINPEPTWPVQSSAPEKSTLAPEASTPVERSTPVPQASAPIERQTAVFQPSAPIEKPTPVIEPTAPIEKQVPTITPTDGTSLFKERQKQFLLGKKVIQDIKDARGSVIIQAGTIVTEDIFNLADKQGKFMELSEFAK